MLANARALLCSLGFLAAPAAFAEEPTGLLGAPGTPLVHDMTFPVTVGAVSVEAAPAPTPVQDAIVQASASMQNLGEVMKMTGLGLGIAGLVGGTGLAWAARRVDRKFNNALTVVAAEERLVQLRSLLGWVQKWQNENEKEALRSHVHPSDHTPANVGNLTSFFLEALTIERDLPGLLLNEASSRNAGEVALQARALRVEIGNVLARQLELYSKDCLNDVVFSLFAWGPFEGNDALTGVVRSLMRDLGSPRTNIRYGFRG